MAWLSRRRANSPLANFRGDDRGTTAILFALIVTPVLCISLAALDYSAAGGRRSKLQDTADSATRAAATLLGSPHNDVENVVRAYMQANLPPDKNTYTYHVTFGPDDSSLTMHVNDHVNTSILKLAGVHQVEINIESTAERPVPATDPRTPRPGIDPDPQSGTKRQSGGVGGISAQDAREAERAIQQIVQQLRESGVDINMRDLMREMRQR